MRVYVETDLDGVTGICLWEQVRDRQSPLYQVARRLLMEDIAALVDGLMAGGATEVAVDDCHGGGGNFMPELMDPRATYLAGRGRPNWTDRDEQYGGYDACVLLGIHAMAGTPKAFLCHTQSAARGDRYWYNDRESGEMAQVGLYMGHYGIPLVMMTGDVAACREAHDFFGPDMVKVAVKEAYSVEYGKLLPPAKAHELIREGAKEAMTRVARCQPYVIDMPIRGRVRFPDKSSADAFHTHRSQRVDDYTYETVFDDATQVYSF